MTVSSAKQVWWPRKGVATIEHLDLPKPGPTDVVVETECSLFNAGSETAFLYGLENTPSADTTARPDDEAAGGVRGGWDQHGWRSGNDFFPRPPEAGSIAGVVVEVGADVTRVERGARVQISTYPHASHAVVAEARLNVLADSVASEDSLFIAPAHVALFGVQKAQVQLGESVVIVGLGQIGQIALQFARLMGARPVIAVDPVDRRLQLAGRLGADHLVNPALDDVTTVVNELTAGEGAAVVIDASGSPTTLPDDFRMAKRFGRVVILGSPRGVTPEVNFYREVMWKNLFVMGAHVTGAAPELGFHLVPWQFGVWTSEQQRSLIVRLIEQRDVDFATMAASTIRMSHRDVQEAYRIAFEERDRALNVILDWKASPARM